MFNCKQTILYKVVKLEDNFISKFSYLIVRKTYMYVGM